MPTDNRRYCFGENPGHATVQSYGDGPFPSGVLTNGVSVVFRAIRVIRVRLTSANLRTKSQNLRYQNRPLANA